MNSDRPSISEAVDRVRAWLSAHERGQRAQVAATAEVDEKTVRVAADIRKPWNPTAATLQKLHSLIPIDWKPGDPLPERDQGEAA